MKSQQERVPVNVPVNVPVKYASRTVQMLELMSNDSGVTIKDLATSLGVSEKTVKRDIAALRADGVIRREGSDKTGRWIALANDMERTIK